MQMNLRYDYSPSAPQASQIALLDTFKGLSILNSKNVEYSSRDGHVMGALVDITYTTNDAGATTATVYGVPNTWKLHNAFRKFHIFRQEMFKEQGVTKSEIGRYSHTIRPNLFDSSISTDDLDIQIGDPKPVDLPVLAKIDSNDATGGDWDRTTFVSASQYTLAADAAIADTWTVHLLGKHQESAGGPVDASPRYVSVGMIHAYNQDRQQVQVQLEGTAIKALDNPLAALITQDVTSGELSEIVSEQETQLPPYDLVRDGDSVKPVALGEFRSTSYFDTGLPSSVTLKNVFLPAGFAAIDMGKGGLTGTFDVCVKALVECREWA